jgi:hypothetical protein
VRFLLPWGVSVSLLCYLSPVSMEKGSRGSPPNVDFDC